jgi:hypothetical protein
MHLLLGSSWHLLDLHQIQYSQLKELRKGFMNKRDVVNTIYIGGEIIRK